MRVAEIIMFAIIILVARIIMSARSIKVTQTLLRSELLRFLVLLSN